MKKILIYGGEFDKGGVESLMMNVIRLSASNYKFDVLALRESKGHFDEELESLKVNVIIMRPCSSQGVLSFYYQLICIIKKGKYDIIHINGTQSSFLVLVAAKKCKVKIRIFHAHNTQDAFLNGIKNRFLRKNVQYLLSAYIRINATKFLACGKDAGEFVFGEKKRKNKSIFMFNNAIDLNHFCLVDSFTANKIRTSFLHSDCSGIVVGNAGRFTLIKNQLYLIKVIESLIWQKEDVVLYLAGVGPEFLNCKKYVLKHNLCDRIFFLGNISNMEEFYKSIDVFALPSLYEGFPFTLIEAQACGIPCILSDNISNEVDIGIGLINKVNLDAVDLFKSAIIDHKRDRIYPGVSAGFNSKIENYGLKKLTQNIKLIYDC